MTLTKRGERLALLLGAALLAAPVAALAVQHDSQPACATEDSNGCCWNAAKQGNGLGRSYCADAQGVLTYR